MASQDKSKASAKKEQSFRKRILTDDEIKVVAGHMRESMGPAFSALSDEYGLRSKTRSVFNLWLIALLKRAE